MKTEAEIMIDVDVDRFTERYCAKVGCRECNGTDMNGEPNGYGCQDQEDYAQKCYQSILKRRLKKT